MVPQSSDRNLTPPGSTVGEPLAAADLGIERGYAMPGLILLYSLVDTMAWLSLPEGVEDVKGTDFIGWVRTYGLEQRVAPCTADELYGARCGLLHSFSPDSRRSRRGGIRPIYYRCGRVAGAATTFYLCAKERSMKPTTRRCAKYRRARS